MEPPALITRQRKPFLLPVWLTFSAFFALFVVAVIAFFLWRSARTTVVVLARHAEKEMSTIQDPPLSPEGEQRAQRLAQMFGRGQGAGHLDAIYVSDARRTQQTAEILAEQLGERPIPIPAADIKGTATRILHDHRGDRVLVVGHSNTVPALIRELADIDVPPIAADEYDTLYVVSIPTFGRANVLRMEY